MGIYIYENKCVQRLCWVLKDERAQIMQHNLKYFMKIKKKFK